MTRLTIIIMILSIILPNLTSEERRKIPNLTLDAYRIMSDNDRLKLINRLIDEYNQAFAVYSDNSNIILEKDKQIEKYKKTLQRQNIMSLNAGLGINFQLQQSINFQLSYTRLFFQLFSFGASLSYNHNIQSINNSQFVINIGFGYIF